MARSCRVKASYADGEGVEKVAYKLSYHAVRAAVPDESNSAPDYDDTEIDSSIPENASVVRRWEHRLRLRTPTLVTSSRTS